MLVVVKSANTPGSGAPATATPPVSAGIPHFDMPFRYFGGKPVVNEQDSIEDIAACVYAVLVTPPGTRDEMPDFGFEDPAFSQQPLSSAAMAAQISEWEPRASVLVDVAPDALDAAVANANIHVEANS